MVFAYYDYCNITSNTPLFSKKLVVFFQKNTKLNFMNRIQVILTLDMENLPSNFPEILKLEQEIVAKWKEQGILEHLFLRQAKNGAVLIFKDVEEEQVKDLMEILPFYKLKLSVEYFNLIQQF
jgi:hypothetical protein